MTNNSSAIQKEIKVKGQKLGTVTSYIKYLGAVGSCFRSWPKTLDHRYLTFFANSNNINNYRKSRVL